jgi:hypothetical protein
VWRFRAGGPGEGPERIVPDGRCELVVHVGRPFAEIAADGTQATQPRALFAGQVTRPLHLASRGAPHVIGVRFHPAGARAFLGRPVDGATDRRLALRDARELATVLAGGTPIVEALEIARGAVSNRFVSRGLVSAVNEIREGSTLAAAIERPKILPKLAIEMLSVGEETGSLEPMLRDVAEFYEGDLDVRLSQLTTWIEPVYCRVFLQGWRPVVWPCNVISPARH